MLKSRICRICIIEENPLIADDFSATLCDSGYQVEALMASEALGRQEAWFESFDAAIVDFDSWSARSVVEQFEAGRVPVALLTAFERDALPKTFRRHLTIGKPLADGRLQNIAIALTADRS